MTHISALENQMETKSLSRQRDFSYYINPYTNLKANEASGPLVIERGDGVFVYDEDGKEYLEGMSGLWCVSLGFSESRLIQAAEQQMKTLPYYHSFTGKVPAVTLELSERLVEMAPKPMSKVLYANSGSESNDTAVKVAWYYQNALGRPDKKKIISRLRGYHGVTITSGSLTGMDYAHKGFDLPRPHVIHAEAPHYFREALPGESEEAFTGRLADSLEHLILKENPDTIAAMIAEPVQGAGGVIIPPEKYFQAIQPILRKYQILLIADEVICGFGRTGEMFGSTHFDIEPDMMVVAKQLSSGYQPISGLLISDAVYQVMREQSAGYGMFGHGYTYSGHPVPAAVALETLKIYEERNLVQRVSDLAPRFSKAFRELEEHPMIGTSRSLGLIGALELVRDKKKKEFFDPSQKIGAHLVAQAQQHGLILRTLPGDIIACCPPLIISESEMDEMFSRFKKAIDETANHFLN